MGRAIAAVGIALSQRLQMPAWDGAASMLFGIPLAGVATLFAWQSRGLLTGEGIRRGTARAIRSIALAPPGVRDVGRLLSMYVRPDDALVTMDFDFNEGTAAADVALAMAEVGAGWSSACWRSTSWTRRGCSTCYRTLRAHGSMCSICRWATLTPPTCARRCDGSDDRPGWPH